MKRTPPRSAFGAWKPRADRDVAAILADQERTRLPELLPLRHERMRASPFAFYRGAAAVMAADLADLPVTGISVQACGDAHLLNFGAYGSPERNVVFDVNDFDETLPGPWEWDVLRLAASVELVARGAALGRKRATDTVVAAVSTYRNAVRHFAELSPLDVWYQHINLENLADAASLVRPQDVARQVRAAKTRTVERLLPSLTAADKPRFVDQPPTFVRVPLDGDEALYARKVLATYRTTLAPHVRRLLDRFVLTDAALKVVGVGSVGTRCYVALLLSDHGEPLLLQLKEAEASVLAPYVGASEYAHHGERVVQGQRLIQAASDIFLGWTTSNGICYYVRQLRDMKASVAVQHLGARDLTRYVRLCAWTLAHAHSRSGAPRLIAGYVGKSDAFDRSVAAFAQTYADVTEADHRRFSESGFGQLRVDGGQQ